MQFDPDKDLLAVVVAGVLSILRMAGSSESMSVKCVEILTCSILGYGGHFLVTGMGMSEDFSVVVACLIGLWGTDAVRDIMKDRVDKL